MTRSSLLLSSVLPFVRSGCFYTATTLPYRGNFYGVPHSNIEEAEQARSSVMAGALAEITPLPSSPLVDRTLIVAIPPEADLKIYRDNVDPPAWNKAAQGYRDFGDRSFVANATLVANAIRIRGIYKAVEIVQGSTTAPEPVPTASKDFLYWKFNPKVYGAQMLIHTEKSGQVALVGDTSSPTLGGSMKALVNNVASTALSK